MAPKFLLLTKRPKPSLGSRISEKNDLRIQLWIILHLQSDVDGGAFSFQISLDHSYFLLLLHPSPDFSAFYSGNDSISYIFRPLTEYMAIFSALDLDTFINCYILR